MPRVIMISGCRGKPADNQTPHEQRTFKLRRAIARVDTIFGSSRGDEAPFKRADEANNEPPHVGCYTDNFFTLALELFALQFQNNPAYRKICAARKLTPQIVEHWTQIPAVPTSAFKELDLTSLPPDKRAVVFHSSGTTEQKPSRHFHCSASLRLYEDSLWSWFHQNVPTNLRFTIYDLRSPSSLEADQKSAIGDQQSAIFLTPSPVEAPHSSLVHMFETVRQKLGAAETAFVGKIAADSSWILDFDATLTVLGKNPQSAIRNPQLILGTAFSFVHLLDYLVENNLQFRVAGEFARDGNRRIQKPFRVRCQNPNCTRSSRSGLALRRENIICEYGMSELSSQAYAVMSNGWRMTREASNHSSVITRRLIAFIFRRGRGCKSSRRKPDAKWPRVRRA